ncbi:hypothetical protein BaRGS_00009921 [Batillaria attramentaria]|uniref:Uncharacterized protein n=1 Tax=Batillaria attramentaria TaxID=370345 RepID=A0ABD0LH70_9CAEN
MFEDEESVYANCDYTTTKPPAIVPRDLSLSSGTNSPLYPGSPTTPLYGVSSGSGQQFYGNTAASQLYAVSSHQAVKRLEAGVVVTVYSLKRKPEKMHLVVQTDIHYLLCISALGKRPEIKGKGLWVEGGYGKAGCGVTESGRAATIRQNWAGKGTNWMCKIKEGEEDCATGRMGEDRTAWSGEAWDEGVLPPDVHRFPFSHALLNSSLMNAALSFTGYTHVYIDPIIHELLPGPSPAPADIRHVKPLTDATPTSAKCLTAVRQTLPAVPTPLPIIQCTG